MTHSSSKDRRTQLWIHVSCLLYLMLNAECSSKVRSLGPPSNFDVSARVVELKDERMFRAETLKTQLAVVYFYATECSPCMNFEPRFEELVRKCNDLDDVNFIKVEAGKFKTIAKRNGVDSYPTLIFFNSKREDKFLYMGKTDAKSMYSKVDEELKLGLSQLVSVQAHDYTPLVFDNNADSVLLFLEQGCRGCLQAEKDMIKIMETYQKEFGDHKIRFLKNDASVSKVLIRIYDVMEFPTVWFFPRYFKEGIVHKGLFNISYIHQLIDFHFGYTDHWSLKTFGMMGRDPKIEDLLNPQLDLLRSGKALADEVNVLVNKVDHMFEGEIKKYYIAALKHFPSKKALKKLQQRQEKIEEKIFKNFNSKKGRIEDNEKLIYQWNTAQYFKEFKYVPKEEIKQFHMKDEL